MANLTINDIFTFLETRIQAAIPELRGKVKVTRKDEPYPGVIANYGVRMYLGEERPKETEYLKIGPIARETWRINVDFIFNRDAKSRELYSDSRGISYWENILTSTLKRQNNNGVFKDSWWEFEQQVDENDAVILKGIFNCELENTY